MKNKQVKVKVGDLYQFLISECRYGYTRNNHLMPWSAFNKVKDYIDRMYKVDKDRAIDTLKQICEECISDEINSKFYDGEDDEFGNRYEAINFVYWCINYINDKIDVEWVPYNYNVFISNITLDDEPRYMIIDLDNDEVVVDKEHALSVNELSNYLFKDYPTDNCIYFNKIRSVDEETHKINFIYKIHESEDSTKKLLVKHI